MEKFSKELNLTQDQKIKIGEIIQQMEEKRHEYFLKNRFEIEQSMGQIRRERKAIFYNWHFSFGVLKRRNRGLNILYGSMFRWVGTKRGEISALFGAIAVLDVWFGNAWPVDPFRPDSSPRFWTFWSLFLAGIVVRIWAAGVINKCKEVTRIGIYRLVRHPLYLGTLLIYLSFFLGFGNIFLGGALLFLMTLIIYFPRMLHEEELMLRRFPSAYRQYAAATPRLIPRLSLISAAFQDGGFSIQKSYQNLGIKSLFGITLLPFIFEVLIKLKERL